jgi:hypothetical protein
MAFQRHEIPNSEKSRAGEAKSASRHDAIGRSEKYEIDTIAQHSHAFLDDPEGNQPLFQPAGHCDQSIRQPGRPADPPPRDRAFRDEIEVAAPGGDADRPTECMSKKYRRDAVRIKIMGVDQIKVPSAAELSTKNR